MTHMQSLCPKCGSPSTVEVFRTGRALGKLKDRVLIRCSRNKTKGKPRCKVAFLPFPFPVPTAPELATAADQVEVQPERPPARVRLRQAIPAPRKRGRPRKDRGVVLCSWLAAAAPELAG